MTYGDGFPAIAVSNSYVSIYSEEFQNDVKGQITYLVPMRLGKQSGDQTIEKYYYNTGVCMPVADSATRKQTVGPLVWDAFYRVAKIKTPSRKTSVYATYDTQEITYTPVTGGSNGNWLY